MLLKSPVASQRPHRRHIEEAKSTAFSTRGSEPVVVRWRVNHRRGMRPWENYAQQQISSPTISRCNNPLGNSKCSGQGIMTPHYQRSWFASITQGDLWAHKGSNGERRGYLWLFYCTPVQFEPARLHSPPYYPRRLE